MGRRRWSETQSALRAKVRSVSFTSARFRRMQTVEVNASSHMKEIAALLSVNQNAESLARSETKAAMLTAAPWSRPARRIPIRLMSSIGASHLPLLRDGNCIWNAPAPCR